jgi:hypothetical protein
MLKQKSGQTGSKITALSTATYSTMASRYLNCIGSRGTVLLEPGKAHPAMNINANIPHGILISQRSSNRFSVRHYRPFLIIFRSFSQSYILLTAASAVGKRTTS